MWEKIFIGLQLTLYGTGLVFVVLAFLWGLMSLLLRLDRGAEVEARDEKAARPAEVGHGEMTPQERAAVTLAVLAHKGLLGKPPRARVVGETHIPPSNAWVAVGRARQLGRPRRG